ncbi:MAG: PorT family protein [Bacteroidia bacterium]|nr:PorT family protein [Bacteroidia bacterium]MDW8089749.1 outer membrane beta-barrel protein [Bacteroidia bacterium]
MRRLYWISRQMWLLPFLASSVLLGQSFDLGIVGGPQLGTYRASLGDFSLSETEFGLFGGPSLLLSLNDNLRFSADLLISWTRFSSEDREDENYTLKYTRSNVFLKIPIMARYKFSLGSFALEGGAGLQLGYWLAAQYKETITETYRDMQGNRVTTTSTRSGSLFEDDDSEYNRIALSIPLMAGAVFPMGNGELGAYLRWDPMVTNLYGGDGDFRLTHSTLGIMVAYYFGLGR